jgi:hypothetical protein
MADGRDPAPGSRHRLTAAVLLARSAGLHAAGRAVDCAALAWRFRVEWAIVR